MRSLAFFYEFLSLFTRRDFCTDDDVDVKQGKNARSEEICAYK